MDQVREVARSYTIELPILSNTNSKINFSDNETVLDDKIITAVAILPNLVNAVAPSGRALLDVARIYGGFITLCDKNREELNKMLPLELLLRNDPIVHLKPRMISIRNSFCEFPLITSFVIPAGPPPGLSMVFTFFYEDFDPARHRVGSMGDVELISER